MTTFTTEDRIIAEKDGSFTINVEGSPPHIVDSGASVMIKELSDEEIVRISETCDLNHVLGLIDFARAILKRAQEK